jgi:hypothetical protein
MTRRRPTQQHGCERLGTGRSAMIAVVAGLLTFASGMTAAAANSSLLGTKMLASFAGRTALKSTPGKEFTYVFLVPFDDRYEVSWSYKPYGPPRGESGSANFEWVVGPYRNPLGMPCNASGIYCNPRPAPASGHGVQTMFTDGSGWFWLGVMANQSQWRMQILVERVSVPPQRVLYSLGGTGPGGTTRFTIPASAPYWQVSFSSYSCAPRSTTLGWTVYTPKGKDLRDTFRPSGWTGYAPSPYYDHGSFYLSIDAGRGCTWSVRVMD